MLHFVVQNQAIRGTRLAGNTPNSSVGQPAPAGCQGMSVSDNSLVLAGNLVRRRHVNNLRVVYRLSQLLQPYFLVWGCAQSDCAGHPRSSVGDDRACVCQYSANANQERRQRPWVGMASIRPIRQYTYADGFYYGFTIINAGKSPALGVNVGRRPGYSGRMISGSQSPSRPRVA
jgi:hypothetical protein